MRVPGKRISTIAAGAVAAIGIVTAVGATPAAADTARVTYNCTAEGGGTSTDQIDVTLTVPATAAVGSTVTLAAATVTVAPQPFDIPAGAIQVSLDVVLGGASSGTVTATGLTNPAIPANTPVRLNGGSVAVPLNSAGEVTFSPSTLESTNGSSTCVVAGGAPVAARTVVS